MVKQEWWWSGYDLAAEMEWLWRFQRWLGFEWVVVGFLRKGDGDCRNGAGSLVGLQVGVFGSSISAV
ncbi:hypothetical protein Hanom_Chr09g00761151 [Helianthus anomalus]